MEEKPTVHVYDLITGKHLTRLPYSRCSWNESLNQAGGINVDVDMNDIAARMNLCKLLRCWKVIISYEDPGRIIHAGPLTSVEWDADQRRLSLTCGGGLTLLTKRLVLNHRLRDTWRDGNVTVDEQHPAGDLALTAKGSARDVIRTLIEETMQWGSLPFTLPQVEGGELSRTYNAWDLATIAERIEELDAEYRFPATHKDNGDIMFLIEAAETLASPDTPLWNAIVPDSRVILDGLSSDGGDMSTQIWSTGGKDNDRVYMCRRTSNQLTDQGWTLMQSRDTANTTVSELRTLQSSALARLSETTWPMETIKLKVGKEHHVNTSDHIDVTIGDDYLGTRTLHLKVTDISGDSDSDWINIQAQERYE